MNWEIIFVSWSDDLMKYIIQEYELKPVCRVIKTINMAIFARSSTQLVSYLF